MERAGRADESEQDALRLLIFPPEACGSKENSQLDVGCGLINDRTTSLKLDRQQSQSSFGVGAW